MKKAVAGETSQDTSTSVAVAVQEETTAVAVVSEIDFSADAGVGTENIKGKDMSIPFYQIIQKGSPQVDELSPKFIEGAKAGMIMNSVTSEIFSAFDVIPCGFSKELVEWKSRDSGGGFVGRHAENSAIVKKCTKDPRGRFLTPEGNTLLDTAYHFVVVCRPDGNFEWGIISMTSTQMKKSRLWNSQMKNLVDTTSDGRKFNPPSFSRIYHFATVGETKDKYSWYGWTIEMKAKVSDAGLYKTCKEFAKAIADGSVQISAPVQDDTIDVAPASDEVPF